MKAAGFAAFSFARMGKRGDANRRRQPIALTTSSQTLFREMKMRRNYAKPSERRAREKAEAVGRYGKVMRKRMDRGDC